MRLNLQGFDIVIIGYNRPDLLRLLITSIRSHLDLSGNHIYLSLDGPKNLEDTRPVMQCQELFDEFAVTLPNSTKLYCAENLGLRANVIRSINAAFQLSERLLVLEDDCEIGVGTGDYFSWAFSLFEGSRDLGAISGTHLGEPQGGLAYQCKRFNSWGWGTTKDVWEEFIGDRLSQRPVTESRSHLRMATRTGSWPDRLDYLRILKHLGELDSWAVPFDMFLRERGLLTVKPGVNQIRNNGFDSRSSHTLRGTSLSLPTGPFNPYDTQLLGSQQSRKMESKAAWKKLMRVAKELVSPVHR